MFKSQTEDRTTARKPAHGQTAPAQAVRTARAPDTSQPLGPSAELEHEFLRWGAMAISQASAEQIAAWKVEWEVRDPVPAGKRPLRDRRLLDSWADFLAPHFGLSRACNITGTYTDAYGYSHGLMLPRNVMKDFTAFRRSLSVSGRPFCIGVEKHPSGRDVLHLHALIGGHWSDAELELAAAEWRSSRGWTVVKAITNRAGCVEYAAKHLLKQRAEDHFDFSAPQLHRRTSHALRTEASTAVPSRFVDAVSVSIDKAPCPVLRSHRLPRHLTGGSPELPKPDLGGGGSGEPGG